MLAEETAYGGLNRQQDTSVTNDLPARFLVYKHQQLQKKSAALALNTVLASAHIQTA
jgi:hypothetical protein